VSNVSDYFDGKEETGEEINFHIGFDPDPGLGKPGPG